MVGIRGHDISEALVGGAHQQGVQHVADVEIVKIQPEKRDRLHGNLR